MDKSHLTAQEVKKMAKKVERAKENRKLGKLAETIRAAARLKGRALSAKEERRQSIKAFKRQQKRMERQTKAKYPAPTKTRPIGAIMAKDAQKQVEALRAENHKLTNKISELKGLLDQLTKAAA